MKKRIGKVFKIVLLASFIFVTATVLALHAFAADTSCKTKYPIIMVHGMGFMQNSVYPNSFPGIDNALQARGAILYFPQMDPIQTTRVKAEQFAAEFKKIQALYPAGTKFNIIAHSHGGVFSRDAISNLGLAPYVASYTSVDSPHRGSPLSDYSAMIYSISPTLAYLVAGMLPFPGDQTKLNDNMNSLTSWYMIHTFNPNTPNMPGIYYQSWTGAFRIYDMIYMAEQFIPLLIQELFGNFYVPATPQEYVANFHKMFPAFASQMFYLGSGYNDGMIPVSSAKWGTFRGTEYGSWWSYGVDHLDMVNMNPNGVNFDVVGGYVKLVKDLKAKGY